MQSVHGKLRKGCGSSVLNDFILLIVFAPILEEYIFRYPILFLVQQDQIVWSLVGAFVGGAIFGALHRRESFGFYSDGTEAYYSNVDCLSLAFGGLCFGLVTIIGASIWPAIIAHSLWNGSVFLREHSPEYNKIIERCYVLLQR